MRQHYEVIVGNVGTVYSGSRWDIAVGKFHNYVRSSMSDIGRASGEDVVLMRDGEPVKEYAGALGQGGL